MRLAPSGQTPAHPCPFHPPRHAAEPPRGPQVLNATFQAAVLRVIRRHERPLPYAPVRRPRPRTWLRDIGLFGIGKPAFLPHSELTPVCRLHSRGQYHPAV